MANRADNAWDAFFDYFINYDDTPAEIAERFNEGSRTPIVTAAQVRDWRRRHSRPQLSQLPELGERWARDPLYFAKLLGAVPATGLETELYAQRRIFELQAELHELEAQVRAADTTAATGRIVAAATASGRWAVAVHPAIEGPTDVPMHVADRLEFRPVTDSASQNGEVREALEAELGRVFSQNHVVFAPRVPTVWNAPTISGLSPQQSNYVQPLRYSVTHTVSPFGPARTWDHVGVRSVGIFSITTGTWPFDVASLVAKMLGYGSVNTRGLSRWHRPSGRLPSNEEAARYRTNTHQDLLANPWHRYVWGHVGDIGDDPSGFLPTEALSTHTKLIWLREGDDLIIGLAKGAEATGECSAATYGRRLKLLQQSIADAAKSSGCICYEIECPTAGQGKDGKRAPRWDRTFELSADIVTYLLESGAVLPSALTRSIVELADPLRPNPLNKAVVDWLVLNAQFDRWGIDPPHRYR